MTMDILEPEVSSPPRKLSRRELAIRDIGGKRLTMTGYSISIEVPSNAEMFCAFAEDADAQLDIDQPATSSSSIFVATDVPLMFYPIAPGQGLNVYGTSGKHVSIRFFGRIKEE